MYIPLLVTPSPVHRIIVVQILSPVSTLSSKEHKRTPLKGKDQSSPSTTTLPPPSNALSTTSPISEPEPIIPPLVEESIRLAPPYLHQPFRRIVVPPGCSAVVLPLEVVDVHSEIIFAAAYTADVDPSLPASMDVDDLVMASAYEKSVTLLTNGDDLPLCVCQPVVLTGLGSLPPAAVSTLKAAAPMH